MSQVDDLRTLALQDASHDIDGGIMAIEEAGSGHDPDLIPQNERGRHILTVVRLQR
jgi:hypothetical protein